MTWGIPQHGRLAGDATGRMGPPRLSDGVMTGEGQT